jgi:hypothetical protein
MTRDEIMKLEAGEEIDRLVAEKIMGWHLVKRTQGRDEWRSNLDDRYQHLASRYDGYEDAEDFHTICWHPSESILWAWEVVEQMQEKAFYVCISTHFISGFDCVMQKSGIDIRASAETSSLAICRAALLALTDN